MTKFDLVLHYFAFLLSLVVGNDIVRKLEYSEWLRYSNVTEDITFKTMRGTWTLQSSSAYIPHSTVLLLLEKDVSYTISDQISKSSALEIVRPGNEDTHYLFLYYDDVPNMKEKMNELSQRMFKELDQEYPSIRDSALNRMHFAIEPVHADNQTWLDQVIWQWREPSPTVKVTYLAHGSNKEVILDATPCEGDEIPSAPGLFTGQMAFLGEACSYDPPAQNVSGKVALVSRTVNCGWRDQINRALRDGATGVIIFTDFYGKVAMRTQQGHYEASVPIVMIDHEPGLDLQERLLGGLKVDVTIYSRESGPNILAIDRLGRLRRFGELYSSFEGTINQTMYFDYEYHMHKKIDDLTENGFAVPLIDRREWDGNKRHGLIQFPDHIPSVDYNSFHLFIDLMCEHALDTEHCKWVEQGYHVFLCPANATTGDCLPEFPQVHAAYLMGAVGRESKTLQDVSPLLWMFNKARNIYGTLPPFRMDVTERSDIAVITAYFSRDDSRGSMLPYTAFPLWVDGYKKGEWFDQTYNRQRHPIEVELPQSTSDLAIAGFITGHGWGTDDEDCAEYCPSSHHFSIDGKFSRNITFSNAADPYGCKKLISEGTVPDQYGSWMHGHAGYCAGKGVDMVHFSYPVSTDESQGVVPGKSYNITYSALLYGQEYAPTYEIDHDPDPERTHFRGSQKAKITVDLHAIAYAKVPSLTSCGISTLSNGEAVLKWVSPDETDEIELQSYKVMVRQRKHEPSGASKEGIISEEWYTLDSDQNDMAIQVPEPIDAEFFYEVGVAAQSTAGRGAVCVEVVDYPAFYQKRAFKRMSVAFALCIMVIFIVLFCFLRRRHLATKIRNEGYRKQTMAEEESLHEETRANLDTQPFVGKKKWFSTGLFNGIVEDTSVPTQPFLEMVDLEH